MWVQALCFAGILAVVGLTPASKVAICLGLATGAWWLGLNMSYAKALVIGEGKDRRWRDRSDHRRAGDRHVPRQVLLVVMVSAGAMLEIVCGMDGWLSDDRAFVVCTSIVAGIGFTIYASSLIDWYYVLPCRRRDPGASVPLVSGQDLVSRDKDLVPPPIACRTPRHRRIRCRGGLPRGLSRSRRRQDDRGDRQRPPRPVRRRCRQASD